MLLLLQVEVEWLNLDATIAPILRDSATKWVRAWRDLDGENVAKYSQIMYRIAEETIQDRKSNPRDPEEDPASSLLLERDANGLPLPDAHLVGAIRQSLVVGTVAPPIILGSICQHLTRHPELQNQLRENPELLPAATEEFLRLYTPCKRAFP
jgi:cytochrome P450